MASPARELSSINFNAMLGGPLIAVVRAQAQAAMSTVNFIKEVGFRPAANADPTRPETDEPIYVAFKYPKEVAPFDPGAPGEVTQISITNSGSGFTSAPTVTIAAPPSSPGARPATADAVGSGDGIVVSITITDPGAGYTSAPAVTISGGGGTGATATAVIDPARPRKSAEFETMKLEVPILTILPIPFIRIEETTIDFNAKINSVEETTTDETLKTSGSGSAKVKYPPLFAIASVNLKVSSSYQKNTQSGSKVDRTYSMAVHIRAVQDEMPEGMVRLLGILEDSIKSQPANLT